jgi:putative NADH-flavin reductase
MKLVVLGATGGIGLEIVQQAIEHGHTVTAFVRSPERLKPFQDRITVIQGNVLNNVELERVIEGQDAVLSGFGPRPRCSMLALGALLSCQPLSCSRIRLCRLLIWSDGCFSPAL